MSTVSAAIPIVQQIALHDARPETLQPSSPTVAAAAHQPAYVVSIATLPPIQQPRDDINLARGEQAGPTFTLAAAIQAAAVHQSAGVSWSVIPDATERVTAVASVAATPPLSAIRGSEIDVALNARAAAIVARDSVGTVGPQGPSSPTIDDPTAPFVNVFA